MWDNSGEKQNIKAKIGGISGGGRRGESEKHMRGSRGTSESQSTRADLEQR